ncbi:hypothetical protein WMF45_04650 [Sorangium sp. So ce448]|uniref:hypothetical protein n=1 Tax=Sorangium sp. So ce448 TaxID=3133314 RepID=UPI003F608A16
MSWVTRPVLAALSVAIAAALSPACDGDSPSEDPGAAASTGSGAGGGNGGGGGDATYGASACGTCVEQTACLSQVNACAADPGCAAYLDCLDACPLGPGGDADIACEQACPPVTGSLGQSAKQAFIDCRLAGPGAECAGCGQIPAPTDPDFDQTCSPSTDPNTCYKCEDERCCETYQACKDDQDCQDLVTCVKACAEDPDDAAFSPCESACYQAHAAGYVAYSHRMACMQYFCFDDDACGNEPLDPCVKCQNLHCADEMAACQHEIECALLDNCKVPCDVGDQACLMECDAMFPDAVATHEAGLDCALAHCEIACGGTD